jgi:hypothetical protein
VKEKAAHLPVQQPMVRPAVNVKEITVVLLVWGPATGLTTLQLQMKDGPPSPLLTRDMRFHC